MKKNYSKILFVLFLSLLFGSYQSSAQVTITQWNFDSENLIPVIGSGTATNIGVTTTAYATGNPGRGWNTTPYPEQSTGSGTSGVQFSVSTTGYSGIVVSWDNRHSNTAANRLRLQYTLNGNDWLNFEASDENAVNNHADGQPVGFDEGRYVADTGVIWYVRNANFSDITGANENPLFAVRIVTEFVDGESYGAATPASTYGTSGTIRFDNVTFSGGAGTSPLITASPSMLSGFSYVIGEGPSEAQATIISGSNLTPAIDDITIAAPISYEVSTDSLTFTESITSGYTSGSITGLKIYVRLKTGLPAGSYNEVLNISGGGANELNVQLSGAVGSGLSPEITSIILPQFIEGSVPNPNRIPFAYYATLSNLLPNATYRYYNRVVLGTENETSLGAGNIILVKPGAGTFIRLTSPNLSTPGAYGELTTDANGTYSGWFMTEPTGNATRFKPGNELYARIILNNGNNGSQEETYLTSSESFKVLTFSTTSSDTSGTAVRGVSEFTPKNFVFLYDNESGSNRPLYGTHIESTGLDFASAGNYSPFYLSDVATFNGSWGGIIPNMNASGVKRVEERSLTTGAVVNHYTSSDGQWGATDTRNPSGGVENVLVINTLVGIKAVPAEIGRVFTYNNLLCVDLSKNTNAEVEIINLQGSIVDQYSMNGSRETYQLNVPAGIYLIKISSGSGIFSQKVIVK